MELPFRLASRYLDFTTDFDVALTGLRQHPHGSTRRKGPWPSFGYAFATPSVSCAVAAERRGSVEVEITKLEQEIVAQERGRRGDAATGDHRPDGDRPGVPTR